MINAEKKIRDFVEKRYQGMLDLTGSNLKFWPSDVKKFPGSVNLSYSDISEFPENLEIQGDLILVSTKIEELPNNLTIKEGSLSLNFCKDLKELPKGLKVGQDLEMISTNIRIEDIKHFVDVKGVVMSNKFTHSQFEKHNEDLRKWEKLKKKLPEFEGIL